MSFQSLGEMAKGLGMWDKEEKKEITNICSKSYILWVCISITHILVSGMTQCNESHAFTDFDG